MLRWNLQTKCFSFTRTLRTSGHFNQPGAILITEHFHTGEFHFLLRVSSGYKHCPTLTKSWFHMVIHTEIGQPRLLPLFSQSKYNNIYCRFVEWGLRVWLAANQSKKISGKANTKWIWVFKTNMTPPDNDRALEHQNSDRFDRQSKPCVTLILASG